MKLQILPQCPELPLLSGWTAGHWTQCVAEFFGEDEVETHLHIYNRKAAIRAFKALGGSLPATVKTVSYSAGQEPR